MAIKELTPKDMAVMLGVSRQHIYNIMKRGICSANLAKKIEEITDGKVTIFDINQSARKMKKYFKKGKRRE